MERGNDSHVVSYWGGYEYDVCMKYEYTNIRILYTHFPLNGKHPYQQSNLPWEGGSC